MSLLVDKLTVCFGSMNVILGLSDKRVVMLPKLKYASKICKRPFNQLLVFSILVPFKPDCSLLNDVPAKLYKNLFL
jgi:hypothetical protein